MNTYLAKMMITVMPRPKEKGVSSAGPPCGFWAEGQMFWWQTSPFQPKCLISSLPTAWQWPLEASTLPGQLVHARTQFRVWKFSDQENSLPAARSPL